MILQWKARVNKSEAGLREVIARLTSAERHETLVREEFLLAELILRLGWLDDFLSRAQEAGLSKIPKRSARSAVAEGAIVLQERLGQTGPLRLKVVHEIRELLGRQGERQKLLDVHRSALKTDQRSDRPRTQVDLVQDLLSDLWRLDKGDAVDRGLARADIKLPWSASEEDSEIDTRSLSPEGRRLLEDNIRIYRANRLLLSVSGSSRLQWKLDAIQRERVSSLPDELAIDLQIPRSDAQAYASILGALSGVQRTLVEGGIGALVGLARGVNPSEVRPRWMGDQGWLLTRPGSSEWARGVAVTVASGGPSSRASISALLSEAAGTDGSEVKDSRTWVVISDTWAPQFADSPTLRAHRMLVARGMRIFVALALPDGRLRRVELPTA